MPAIYTIDASVFLNAFNPYEAGYEDSSRFMSYLQERAIPVIVPFLVLPEVSAAISRGSGNAELARQFAGKLEQLPHFVFVPLDATLARQAIDVAANYKVRGSDAVYIATALRFGSTLATLDREQRDRAAAALKTVFPAEALAQMI